MEFTTFDGLRIAYRRDGAGPALVLVHGTGGDSLGNWDGVTGDLAADHTVIRPITAARARPRTMAAR